MDIGIRDIITAAVGIALGVIIEDPLDRFRDNLIHRYKRLFYKKPTQLDLTKTFSLGKIKTDWLILDGNGEEEYVPDTIETHFENKKIVVREAIQKKRDEIEKKQEELHKKGHEFAWNGDLFSLNKFLITRRGVDENLLLELWFRETDYYTFLATNAVIESSDNVTQTNWEQPLANTCNSLGVNLAVITSDEYLILTKRSKTVGTYKDLYHISVNEGLSRTLDRNIQSQAPDIYRCAIRGIAEELGVADVNVNDITLLSFGVDTKHAQWGILGLAKIDKTAEEVIGWRNRGAKDKWESDELHLIKFRLNEVIKFIVDHPHWTPAGLTCVYHTLIHEFKTKQVIQEIEKYLK
jgi:hypothetical protein